MCIGLSEYCGHLFVNHMLTDSVAHTKCAMFSLGSSATKSPVSFFQVYYSMNGAADAPDWLFNFSLLADSPWVGLPTAVQLPQDLPPSLQMEGLLYKVCGPKVELVKFALQSRAEPLLLQHFSGIGP
jgi:hypothetical protein